MVTYLTDVVRFELTWDNEGVTTLYCLTATDTHGQMAFVDYFEQGPFDTALEVAQWAWKRIAGGVRRSSC